jgi:hypothetical protein
LATLAALTALKAPPALVTMAVVTAFALFFEHLHSTADRYPFREYHAMGATMTEAEIVLGADEGLDVLSRPLNL